VSRAAARRALRPADALVLAYAAAVVLVAAWRGVPALPWLVAANLLVGALVALVRRVPPDGIAGALAPTYPLVLLTAMYSEVELLTLGAGIPTHDALVQRWDAALFGLQPSRDWWQAYPSPAWSTILHAAYWAYYPMIALPVLAFLARRDRAALERFVLAIVLTFVPCYLVFILFPVAGPYYAFPHPTGAFVDNAPARLVYATLATGSAYGAAFPSSHVAAAIAATGAAWRGWPALGRSFVLPAALLTVAVVYCQMHYAVDALAGVAVGLAVVALVARRRGGETQRGPLAGPPAHHAPSGRPTGR